MRRHAGLHLLRVVNGVPRSIPSARSATRGARLRGRVSLTSEDGKGSRFMAESDDLCKREQKGRAAGPPVDERPATKVQWPGDGRGKNPSRVIAAVLSSRLPPRPHGALSASGARVEESPTLLDESVLEPPPEKARATVLSSKPGRPTRRGSEGTGARPAGRGPSPRRPRDVPVPTGFRPTLRIVCRRAVEPIEVERELTGVSGAVLTAHEALYKPWREESRAWRDPVTAARR